MSRKSILLLASLGVGLGGCSTLGTNVSGSFRCAAPDGICAPSTVIDDTAIARIEETSSLDLLNPAGPYQMDDGIAAPVHSLQLASAQTASAPPSYTLSVVFPGYTDVSGSVRERRVIKTVADLPGRGDAMEMLALRGSQPSRNRGLLAAAESAPPVLALSANNLGGIPAEPTQPTSPEEAVSLEANNPITRIEEQVNERLAAARPERRKQAASFSGKVE